MEDLSILAGRARMAVIACWLVAGLGVMMVIGRMLLASGGIELDAVAPDKTTMIVAFGYLSYFIAFLLSVVLVCMWIYRAHQRLHELGLDWLEYTPGWAVGWYFIPFANLVKPFQAMRELWCRSLGQDWNPEEPSPNILRVWWGAWLAGNILDSIGTRMVERSEGEYAAIGHAITAIANACHVIAAVLLARIITQITEAQRHGSLNAVTFA